MLAEIWEHLKTALSFGNELSYMLLGEPELILHLSPLSMDKCFKTTCSCIHTQLGSCTNTRNLNLNILDIKRQDLVKILLTTWNNSRKRFTLREVASLLGLVSNLALTTQWVKHTHIALQNSLSIALKFHSNTVFACVKHKYLTYLIRSKTLT